MAQPAADQSLPEGGRQREESAQQQLEATAISRGTAWLLTAFFLAAIAIVPLAEWAAISVGRAETIGAAWGRLFSLPGVISSTVAASGVTEPWPRLKLANGTLLSGLVDFERALEDEALVSRALRPPAQVVMTRWLGAGNERVYPGLDGWLFYRPDVEYVTGRPFLTRAELRRRVVDSPDYAEAPQPDPRPAIRQLKRDLDARGIALILVPTPLKPGVHPDRLAHRDDVPGGVLQNPSFGPLIADLQREGITVFDPSTALVEARQAAPQYLATDTHWRPEAVELVAERLATWINTQTQLSAVNDPGYRLEQTEVRGIGDTARMLDLPEGSTLFPSEAVWARRVLNPDGSPWRSSREADVLVLGDSFTNIYSLESMGWGTGAGLAEHLSYALLRPVDRLVQNDEGAFATRAMLQRDPGRLRGKRVVVYQFAARELSFGDWKILPIP